MAFLRASSKDVPKDEACISGRFVYTRKRKTLKSGHARTDAYVDEQRRLDARFCVEGFQEAIGGGIPPPHQHV